MSENLSGGENFITRRVCELMPLERHEMREALRCILHTIVFNRSLGSLTPCETDCEFFALTFVKNDKPGVSDTVEKAIDSSLAELKPDGPGQWRGQVVCSFYEKREVRGLLWNKEERVCFERWFIPIVVCSGASGGSAAAGVLLHARADAAADAARQQRAAEMEHAVRGAMQEVLTMIESSYEHVPPQSVVFEIAPGVAEPSLSALGRLVARGPPRVDS